MVLLFSIHHFFKKKLKIKRNFFHKMFGSCLSARVFVNDFFSLVFHSLYFILRGTLWYAAIFWFYNGYIQNRYTSVGVTVWVWVNQWTYGIHCKNFFLRSTNYTQTIYIALRLLIVCERDEKRTFKIKIKNWSRKMFLTHYNGYFFVLLFSIPS